MAVKASLFASHHEQSSVKETVQLLLKSLAPERWCLSIPFAPEKFYIIQLSYIRAIAEHTWQKPLFFFFEQSLTRPMSEGTLTSEGSHGVPTPDEVTLSNSSSFVEVWESPGPSIALEGIYQELLPLTTQIPG